MLELQYMTLYANTMDKLTIDYSSEYPKEIDFEIFQSIFEKFQKKLDWRINELLKKNGRIQLILVDDKTIHLINRDFRGHDKPTDVISCAYLEEQDMPTPEDIIDAGDIYISVDTASRQAVDKGHTLEKELKILFAHGLLHLFGFDHQNDEEEEEMESWAKKIID